MLTHDAYLRALFKRKLVDGIPGSAWVQVRRFFNGAPVVLCGQVISLSEGKERRNWFEVQTPVGVSWVDGSQVRMCSGDGRCTCGEEACDHA